MGMVQCDRKLHFYDVDAYPACPFCAEQFGESNAEETKPEPNDIHNEQNKTTVLPDGKGGDAPFKHTTPINRPDPVKQKTETRENERLKTDIIIGHEGNATKSKSSANSSLPVAGWLIITGGPGRGKDFRLIQGENRIGRDPKMEVSLDFGKDSDTSVSRESHAVVVYDNNANEFFIERGASRNLPTVNGKTVRRDQDLEAYDLIQLGETQLMFFPLCGGQFKW